MDYRAFPWKRNYRKVPPHVLTALEEIGGDLIAIAATKTVARAEIERGQYAHVGLRAANGVITIDGPLLPKADAGKWSERNAHGWDRKRTDWPMVTKTFACAMPAGRETRITLLFSEGFGCVMACQKDRVLTADLLSQGRC